MDFFETSIQHSEMFTNIGKTAITQMSIPVPNWHCQRQSPLLVPRWWAAWSSPQSCCTTHLHGRGRTSNPLLRRDTPLPFEDADRQAEHLNLQLMIIQWQNWSRRLEPSIIDDCLCKINSLGGMNDREDPIGVSVINIVNKYLEASVS